MQVDVLVGGAVALRCASLRGSLLGGRHVSGFTPGKQDFIAYAPGHEFQLKKDVELTPGDPTPIDFVLAPAPVTRVLFQDPEERPVEGVRVSDGRSFEVTDSDWHQKLMDGVMDACEDEDLMMEYLESQELTEEQLDQLMPPAIAAGALIPILVCNPESDLGVENVYNFFRRFAPTPACTAA